jgi:hypothetical protein
LIKQNQGNKEQKTAKSEIQKEKLAQIKPIKPLSGKKGLSKEHSITYQKSDKHKTR